MMIANKLLELLYGKLLNEIANCYRKFTGNLKGSSIIVTNFGNL